MEDEKCRQKRLSLKGLTDISEVLTGIRLRGMADNLYDLVKELRRRARLGLLCPALPIDPSGNHRAKVRELLLKKIAADLYPNGNGDDKGPIKEDYMSCWITQCALAHWDKLEPYYRRRNKLRRV